MTSTRSQDTELTEPIDDPEQLLRRCSTMADPRPNDTLNPEEVIVGGSLAVVCSYAPGYEPLVTGNLAMGLTIRSSHKQELSSVYQFIDVLYSLCIYEALRHLSLSCLLLLLQFRVLRCFSSLLCVLSALYLCRAIYTKLVAI